MTDHTTRTLDRLLSVAWGNDDVAYDHVQSRGHLLVEHLRRSALWAQALDVPGEWPWLDVAAHAAPGLRADPAVIRRLDEISVHITWPDVRKLVESALHWATVLDTPGWSLPALPDPYAAILEFFERGGGFIVENRLVDIGLQMIPLKSMADRLRTEPVVSLDKGVLDALDNG